MDFLMVLFGLFGSLGFSLDFLIFKASALWADAFYKSKCPPVRLSVCLCVCSLLRYRLTVFLPPTSRSRMSYIFKDSESLGKNNGKKWSQIWTFFFENCLKLPRKKSFFLHFFRSSSVFGLFQRSFAPTSRSWISNILRDSESLGKINGKKWSRIWTFLFENCLKSPRKKKKNFTFLVFFVFWSFLTVFLTPLPEVGCPIFLEIRHPWGKVMERSGLRYEHFCLKIV